MPINAGPRRRNPPKSRLPEGIFPQVIRLAESHPDVAYIVDSKWRFVAVNRAFEKVFGKPAPRIIGRNAADFLAPAEAKANLACCRKAQKTRKNCRITLTVSRGNLTVVFDTIKIPLFSGQGRFLGILGLCRDITGDQGAREALKKSVWSFRLLSQVNWAVHMAQTETELFSGICKILVDAGGYRMAWVGVVDFDREKTVRPAAWAGPKGYLDGLKISWADKVQGRGPCGRAIRTLKPVLTRDIRADPGFGQGRRDALRRGCRSSLVLPFLLEGKVRGILNIYSAAADDFGKEDIRLLSDLADNVAFGVSALAAKGKSASFVKALVESEGKYRALFTKARDAIILADAESGLFLDANPAAAVLLGRPLSQVIGMNQSEIYPPQDVGRYRKLFFRAAAEPTVGGIAAEVLRADGVIIPVLINAAVMEIGGRKILQGIFTDVSEIQKGVAALRESEQKFKQLAEYSPNMIFINVRGRVVYANKRCEEIMGYSRREFYSGKFDFMKLISPEFQKDVRRSFQRHSEGKDVPAYEYVIITKAGRKIQAIHTTQLIPYAGGKAILGILTDVTERAAIEAEKERHLAREQDLRRAAEEANRSKDEFLAVLSHELRTPMTAMMGWLWLLRTKDMDSREAAEAVDTIERNMTHQAQIIEDLLDVSRIVTGKMRLEPRVIELGPVLLSALDVVRPAAQARSIRLIAPDGMSRLRVLGDAARLQQVFWNLLSNAVKFTPEKGTVSVDLRKSGTNLEVSVKDTGVGIPRRFLDKVFDPFSQAEAALTRDHGGLGLGLAIVHQIVELHGGSVRAFSAGPGKGSVFTVSFPLTRAKPAPAAVSLAAGAPQGNGKPPLEQLSGIHVLVLDDEADALAMIKSVLELCGASVCAAGSAPEAFACFGKKHPDVMVLDLAMPGEDGFSLIRRIRALGPERGGSVPAVALTALARSEDRTRALRSGFQTFLPKPVNPAELAAVVHSLARIGFPGKEKD